MEKMEITIRELDVLLTKVNIAPGDVLVVRVLGRLNDSAAANIRHGFQQAFGVPAIVLQEGIKLEAVLSVHPDCIAEAERLRAESIKRHNESFEEAIAEMKKANPPPSGRREFL